MKELDFKILNVLKNYKNIKYLKIFNCIHILQDWYYDQYISIPTPKAQFIKRIETYTIDKFYKPQNRQIYETPDQLIVAVALNEGVCIDFDKASASVECCDKETRGLMNVDWGTECDQPKRVRIVKGMDEEILSEMMVNCLNNCK